MAGMAAILPTKETNEDAAGLEELRAEALGAPIGYRGQFPGVSV